MKHDALWFGLFVAWLLVGGVTALGSSSLRPRKIYFSFSAEDVAVEVCDPLPPAGGDIEKANRRLDLRCDIGPVELREFIDDVGGRRVAQRLVQPDFFEFMKERI